MKSEVVQRKTVRNSNFELLRIVSMFLIVAAHYGIYSSIDFGNTLSVNRIFIQFVTFLGKFAVSTFVLLSGYFMCTQTKWRWKSVVSFLLQVTVYSALIVVLLLAVGKVEISLSAVLTAVLPLIYGDWWFANAYFILLLISPFLASALSRISKEEFKLLLKVLTVIWCIIPTFINSTMESNSFLWFVYLYLVAAYLRLYPSSFFDDNKKVGKVFIIVSLLVFGSVILFDILGTHWPVFSTLSMFFVETQSLGMAILAICLFCIFKNMKSFENNLINKIATAMFGVYLIHDQWMMREIIWKEIFYNGMLKDSPLLMIHGILSTIGILVICVAVSYIVNIVINTLSKIIFDIIDSKKTSSN